MPTVEGPPACMHNVQSDCTAQINIKEIGKLDRSASKISANQLRLVKHCARNKRSTKIGITKICFMEPHETEIRIAEICALEICSSQIGFKQIGPFET